MTRRVLAVASVVVAIAIGAIPFVAGDAQAQNYPPSTVVQQATTSMVVANDSTTVLANAAGPGSLPFTGSSTGIGVAVALIAFATGAVLVVSARRRRAAHFIARR